MLTRVRRLRCMRSLPAALTLALLAILTSGWSGAAWSAQPAPYAARLAADCPATDVPSSTKTAQAVFTGTIASEPTAAAKTDGSRGAVYDHEVTVETVYQGRIRSSTVQVQTDRTPKQCSLGALSEGQTYMFFVQGDGNPWVAVSGAGTAPATTELVASVESILGAGRPAVQPEPESAQFTELHPAAPQSLTRAAAPGVAMVLVGLLGLALVRSRRRSQRT